MKKKMNKIKNWFKKTMKKPSSRLAFISSIISVVLLLGVTTAWFVSVVNINNTNIKTGTLELVGKAYDKNGEFVSNLDHPLNEGDLSINDVNVSSANLFDTIGLVAENVNLDTKQELGANSANSIYLSLEKAGTLDMDYDLCFVTSGTSDDSIQFMGGYWFRVHKLNKKGLNFGLATYGDEIGQGLDPVPENDADPNKMNYVPVIKDYLSHSENDFIPCGENCYDVNHKVNHICTEHSDESLNMSELEKFHYQSTLTSKDIENNSYRDILRIDFGLCKNSTNPCYTGKSIKIGGRVYSTQLGALENPDGIRKDTTVHDQKTLQLAIDNAINGDTIVLSQNIEFSGDLNINKCVNIKCNGHTLSINAGNFIYDFRSNNKLKIDMTVPESSIMINKIGKIGGNFTINAPLSEIDILGLNGKTKFYVDGNISLNGTNRENSSGITLKDFTFMSKNGIDAKSITLQTDTKLNVEKDVTIGSIIAADKAKNISIYNNGTIDLIEFEKMSLDDKGPGVLYDGDKAQIIIFNYNTINTGVSLPIWSRKFEKIIDKEKVEYIGNTTIYRNFDASNITIFDNNQPFTDKDIDDMNKSNQFVVENGSETDITIFYRTGSDTNNTIKDILLNFYKENKNLRPSQKNDNYITKNYINKLEKVQVITYQGKKITDDDIIYMNDTMDNLKVLDLDKTYLVNNTLKSQAFLDKTSLEILVLPSTVQTLGDDFIKNTSLKYIVLPQYVRNIPNCVYDIPFIQIEGNNPKIVSRSFDNYLFVNKQYLSAFQKEFESKMNKIFVKGEFTDDRMTCVRLLDDGTYEFVVTSDSGISSPNGIDSLTIGSNLNLNGKLIKISKIGTYAFSSYPKPFSIKFDPSIKEISERAFYQSKVHTIDFSGIKIIGNEAFSQSNYLVEFNSKLVNEIGTNAFSNCSNLLKIDLPKVEIIEEEAFTFCDKLRLITFENISRIEHNAFYSSSRVGRDCNYDRFYYFKNISGVNQRFNGLVGKIFADDICFNQVTEILKNSEYPYYIPRVFKSGIRAYSDKNKVVSVKLNLKIGNTEKLYNYDIGEYVVRNEDGINQLITYNEYDKDFEKEYIIPDKLFLLEDDSNSRVFSEFASTINELGDYAYFYNKINYGKNKQLINIIFSDNIYKIGDYSFASLYYVDSKNVKYINFNNVQEIGEMALSELEFLDSFDAPNVTYIGFQGFYRCSSLVTVTLNKLQTLGVNENGYSKVFESCTRLIQVDYGPEFNPYATSYIFPFTKTFKVGILRNNDLKFTDLQPFLNSTNNFYDDTKIYLPKDVLDNLPLSLYGGDITYYTKHCYELGEKVGHYIITTNLSYGRKIDVDLGEYTVIKNCPLSKIENDSLDLSTGLSISSYNKPYKEMDPNYRLPDKLNVNGNVMYVRRYGFGLMRHIDFNQFNRFNDYEDNFEVGEYVLEISDYCFYGTTVTLSNLKNVQYIGRYAFQVCKNLLLVKDAPNLKQVDPYAFNSCSKLQYFNAPNLINVYYRSFGNCFKLIEIYTNVNNTNNFDWLDSDRNLRRVTFGRDKLIDGNSFTNLNNLNGTLFCTGPLNESLFSDGINYLIIDDRDIYYSGIESTKLVGLDGISYIGYSLLFPEYILSPDPKNVGEAEIKICLKMDFSRETRNNIFTIPDVFDSVYKKKFDDPFDLSGQKYHFSINTLGRGSFMYKNFGQNTNVIVSNKIKSIKTYGLYGCTMKSIYGENVTFIGSASIERNKSLLSISFPNLESVVYTGFRLNDDLNSIDVGKIDKAISQFLWNPNLKLITCDNLFYFTEEKDPFRESSINGRLTIKIENEIDRNKLASLAPGRIPNDLNYNDPNLKKNIVDKIQFLVPIADVDLYRKCPNLQGYKIDAFGSIDNSNPSVSYTYTEINGSVTINTVSTINEYITIPSKLGGKDVISIQKGAFNTCVNLKEITLPKTLSMIYDGTFDNLSQLENIYVENGNPYFACTGDLVGPLNGHSGILYNKNITELIYCPIRHYTYEGGVYKTPDSLTHIRSHAFKNSVLNTIVLGKNVKVVGGNAFENCSATTLQLLSRVPPYVTSRETLDNFSFIVVPRNTISDYYADPIFGQFREGNKLREA